MASHYHTQRSVSLDISGAQPEKCRCCWAKRLWWLVSSTHRARSDHRTPMMKLKLPIKSKTLKQNIQWNTIVCTVHAGKSSMFSLVLGRWKVMQSCRNCMPYMVESSHGFLNLKLKFNHGCLLLHYQWGLDRSPGSPMLLCLAWPIEFSLSHHYFWAKKTWHAAQVDGDSWWGQLCRLPVSISSGIYECVSYVCRTLSVLRIHEIILGKLFQSPLGLILSKATHFETSHVYSILYPILAWKKTHSGVSFTIQSVLFFPCSFKASSEPGIHGNHHDFG